MNEHKIVQISISIGKMQHPYKTKQIAQLTNILKSFVCINNNNMQLKVR